MARSGLTPQYVSSYLEPVDPSLCETCLRPRKLLEDGLKRPTCAPAPPDWTPVRMRIHEARADSDVSVCWSRWRALAEGEALARGVCW